MVFRAFVAVLPKARRLLAALERNRMASATAARLPSFADAAGMAGL